MPGSYQQEVQDAESRGDCTGVRRQAYRADPRHHFATAYQIDRIAERTQEHQQCAQRDSIAAHLQVVREGHRHAQVADHQGQQLPATGPAPEHQHAQQQHQGRGEIQDQPLQRGGDEFQPGEIQETGQVVATEAQPHHFPSVATAQAEALCIAPHPGGHQSKEWQRHQHAQRQQGHRIGAIAITQLDDDGLAREGNGTQQGKQDAGPRAARLHRRWMDQRCWNGFVGDDIGVAHASICCSSARSIPWARNAFSSSHSKLSSSI